MTLATLVARFCPTIDNSANDILSRFDGFYQGGMGTVTDTSHGGTRAYEFDGANDRLEVPNVFARGYTPSSDEPFTVAFRVKASSPSSSHTWAGTYNGSGSGWSIGTSSNQIYAGMRSADGGGYASIRVSVPFTSTAWKHVAFTYDGSGASSGIKVYIDGTLATMTDASESTYVKMATQGSLNIGARLGAQFFAGRIDDLMLFNSVLDATAIAAIAAAAPGSLTSDVFFATSFENTDHGFTNVSGSAGGVGWYRSETGTIREGIYGLSGYIGSGGSPKTTTKTITLPRSGVIKFWWKANTSEADCDFKVDGVSEETIPATSWQLITVPLDAGERTLTWTATNAGALFGGEISIDDVYIVLDPPAPLTLDIVGSTSVNVSRGSTGSFTIERSGGDLSASLTIDLASSATGIATVPATLTFLATESTATFTVTSAGNSGSITITASSDEDDAEATLGVSVRNLPTGRLSVDTLSAHEVLRVRSAKYSLRTTVFRQTLGSSFREISTKLTIRNAPGPRTDSIRLKWNPVVDVPSIYRTWIAVQIKMDRPNYEPTIAAHGADSGRAVPVILRGFDLQVLKLLIQPHKSITDPEDVIVEITDYA